MPSMSAMAWAASGISSISHWISTTALTMPRSYRVRGSAALQGHGHAHAAGDAQRSQSERIALLPHLVRAGEHDPGSGHPDGVSQGDGAAVRVQPVVVELELAVAGEHLGGEGLVQLNDLEVLEGQAGP